MCVCVHFTFVFSWNRAGNAKGFLLLGYSFPGSLAKENWLFFELFSVCVYWQFQIVGFGGALFQI